MPPSAPLLTPALNAPTVVYQTKEHATAIQANLVVTFSVAEPDHALLSNFNEVTKKVLAAGEPIVMLVVVDADDKPPSDEVRPEINAALRALGDCLLAVGYVMEGKGFLAAAKRSSVAMIALLARFPFPIKTFGDITEAALWLGTQVKGAKLDARAISAVAEAARSAQREAASS